MNTSGERCASLSASQSQFLCYRVNLLAHQSLTQRGRFPCARELANVQSSGAENSVSFFDFFSTSESCRHIGTGFEDDSVLHLLTP